MIKHRIPPPTRRRSAGGLTGYALSQEDPPAEVGSHVDVENRALNLTRKLRTLEEWT